MSITHRASLRDELCDAVVDKLDLGSTFSNARIVLFDDADVPCTTWQLPYPAMLDSSGGISYPAAAIADDNSPVLGKVPVRFEVQDRDGAWVWKGTVGASGADWLDAGGPIAGPMRCQGFYYRVAL